jgi:hypothetical protein
VNPYVLLKNHPTRNTGDEGMGSLLETSLITKRKFNVKDAQTIARQLTNWEKFFKGKISSKLGKDKIRALEWGTGFSMNS